MHTSCMTQIITILEALALIALYWGGPVAVVALVGWALSRRNVRYHVGNPRAAVPVETFRTKSAARAASMRLYRAHGRCFRITRSR